MTTRSGISWSDARPFSAEDVAFTLNSLKELGPKVTRGIEVSTYVDAVKAIDGNTVQIDFKVPAPRFFYFMTYKYDIGLYMVPKHVYEGQDWTKFTNLDPSKGWPLTTGPWKIAVTSPQQKILDRREGEYWANKAGLTQGPKVAEFERAVASYVGRHRPLGPPPKDSPRAPGHMPGPFDRP